MGEITGDGTAVDTLGGPSGYGETALPRGDEGFVAIDVTAVFEDGIVIGDQVYGADEVFVSTDGLITFGTGVAVLPDDLAALTMPFIAPFLADVDTRIDGEGAESGQIWLDIDTAADCITITWEDVGFYRRNATATNTFQVQLFDAGNGAMDVVIRYESIEWTSGDLEGGTGGTGGSPAQIGYRMDSQGNVITIGPSGDEAGLLALPVTPGNTGVPGLYIFRLGGSPAPIEGTEGADAIFGTGGRDTILGLGGDDLLLGSAEGDLLDGGTGWDTADFTAAPEAVGIDLNQSSANLGWALGDSFISIEAFLGSAHDDFIFGSGRADDFDGSDGNDTLDGRAGDDTLRGGDGIDTLWGKNGDDTLDGGAGDDALQGGTGNDILQGGDGGDSLIANSGDDTLEGGGGNDTLEGLNDDDLLAGGAADDRLYGGAGNDRLSGGDGNDSLIAHSGNDWLEGGAGNDSLEGLNGDDQLFGGAGKDQLFGGSGNDLLSGGDGDDRLTGNAGDDRLQGDAGNDTLEGGAGVDLFVHSGLAADGTDLVTDYCLHHADVLLFGQTGASADQFSVVLSSVRGGTALDATVTYLPTGQVIWVLEDVGPITDILLQSGSSSFTIL